MSRDERKYYRLIKEQYKEDGGVKVRSRRNVLNKQVTLAKFGFINNSSGSLIN
jgi:hypothetical protein